MQQTAFLPLFKVDERIGADISVKFAARCLEVVEVV